MKIRTYLGLLLLAGCADAGHDPSGIPEGENANITQPIAVIDLSGGKKIEFYDIGSEVAFVQVYPIGQAPFLSESDKELSPTELYSKFSPESEVPEALYRARLEKPEDATSAVVNTTPGGNGAGGGSPPPSRDETEIGQTSQALSKGQGCNPPHSNVVFSDCRSNWFGGYWAYAVPTFNFDTRVKALSGSLDMKFTNAYHTGAVQSSIVHAAQGLVFDLHFTAWRTCKTILGIEYDCTNHKVGRRLDLINASSTTFDVDVVFFD